MNGKGSAGLGSLPGPCKSAGASVSAARASPFNFFNYSLPLQDPFFHLFKRNRSVGLSWAACILRGSFIIVPCLNGRQKVSLKSPSATSPSKYLNRSLMGSQPDPPGSRGGFVSARRGGRPRRDVGWRRAPLGTTLGGLEEGVLVIPDSVKHPRSKEKASAKPGLGSAGAAPAAFPVPTSPSLPRSSWSRSGGRGGGR